MSLINDALKRAESEKRAAQPSASTPPLQPAESAPSSTSPLLLLGGIFLLGLGAIGIAAALWFGGRTTQVVQVTPASPTVQTAPLSPEPTKVGSAVPADRVSTTTQTSSQTPPTTSTIASTSTATASTAIAVTNTASLPPRSTPKPVATTTPAPRVTTTKSAASTTPPATTATAQTKPIRLQSIFYRHKNPTVIINGKTLGVGDTVDGIKVDSIRRTSVEIVQNGKYRTLTLQD